MSLSALALVALAVTVPIRCGPSAQEAGQAVLMAAPLVLVLAAALQIAFFALWRRRYASATLRWRPGAIALGLSTVGAIVAIAAGTPGASRWVGQALWMYGLSTVALQLLITRVLVWLRPDLAFTWGHLVAFVLTTLPAPIMAASDALAPLMFIVWIYPGYGGWVTGPLLVITLVEAALNGRRRGKDATAQPPPSTEHTPAGDG